MRARNREVNIFNMSLLDILTGMLGAFLFLMLGLVPYYTKAKALEQNPPPDSSPSDSGAGQQGPQVTNLLNVIAHWDTQSRVSIYLYSPTAGWTGFDKGNPLLPRGVKVDDSGTSRGPGWEDTDTYAHAADRYLVVVSIPRVKPSQPIDPASYSHLDFAVDMLKTQSEANKGGVTSFSPDVTAFPLNTAAVKPGAAYGAFWINVTDDESKNKYYERWDYDINSVDPAKDKLPSGVIPLLNPFRKVGP